MRALPDHRDGQIGISAEDQGGAAAGANTSIVRSRLFLKYIALFVAVVSLALIANGAFEVYFSYQEQKTSLVRIQREQAQAAAGKIGQFIQEIESQVGWTTQLPWSAGTLEQRRFDALRLLRQVPAITELAEIDATGHEQLRVSRLAMDVVGSGADVSKEPAFTEAVAHKVYFGPVYFRRESEPYMTLSLAGTRRDAGVSIAQVNLKLIEDVLSQIKSVGHARAYVVDAQGRLIAHPDISLVLRNTDMSRLEQVRVARAAGANGSAEQVQEATDVAGQEVLTAYAPVAPLGWLVFVETPIEEAYAPLYASIERTGLVLLGALALAFIAGMFLAGRMVVPIQALRAGAARIGSGDLGQRIAIKTGDEVEALADQFNDMAGRLQESYAGLERKVEQRTHELSEALEQQTATSEVLQVISRSPGDLQPVFDTMLKNAVRICDAKFGNVYRWDGDALRLAATFNVPPAFAEARKRLPHTHGPKTVSGRMLATKSVIHIADAREQEAYTQDRDPGVVAAVELGGIRTVVAVPMLKENELIGSFTLYRDEVRPFTEKQIALITSFAAQAVIAVENTRLLTELRESLAQQTATSDVLSVISSSPGDLKPVFDAMLGNAARLCEAQFGNLILHEDGAFRITAMYNMAPGFAEQFQREPVFYPGPSAPVSRAVATRDFVHVVDLALDRAYAERDPPVVSVVELGGARSMLVVPMVKEGEAVGALSIFRQEVRPFTEKQIDLVKNFAAQAVIAIENARLLTELRESLEQQTATAEVLGVINASRGDLQPVFEAMVEKARRLCEADAGHLALPVGDDYRSIAVAAMSPEMAELIRSISYAPGRGTAIGRALAERRPVQISDIGADNEHIGRQAASQGFIRTILGVPLLRGGEAIGAFGLSRQRVEPFSDRQIDLVRTFADQAVIAIENARLFEAEQQRTRELVESLAQQTATSDVLEVISGSPGDVAPVFESVLKNATSLCDAKFGALYLADGELFRPAALQGATPELAEYQAQRGGFVPPTGSLLEAMASAKITIQHDVTGREQPSARLGGARSALAVPMLKDESLVGAIIIYRQDVSAFTDKQIALVENFAAQAVIAIENARLLTELRQSLEQQTATAEVLGVISSSPGDLEPVFAAMLENAVHICRAKFGNISRWDGEALHLLASHKNTPPALVEARRQSPHLNVKENVLVLRMLEAKTAVQVPDASLLPGYLDRSDPGAILAVESGGARTCMLVPMFKENELVGAFTLFRGEVRPFTDKEIALVESFAAQAVIAIENTRLLTELRESLAQQTATSEVLSVISSSPGDLKPVFDAMLANAARLCEAQFGNLLLYEGDAFRFVAMHNVPAVYAERWQREPLFRPSPLAPIARAVATKDFVHVVDLKDDSAYLQRDPPVVSLVDAGGARTLLIVPMIKDAEVIGTLGIFRQEVRPFTDKQIALVESFASQAVIAIENARLLSALRERTDELGQLVEELRALGEISQAVNSTLDLQTVLSTIVAKAVQLSGTDAGAIYVFDGAQREFHLRSTYGMEQELIDALAGQHIGLDEPNVAQAFRQPEPIQVADLQDAIHTDLNEIMLRAGYRARLVAPLTRGEDVVGMLVVRRRTPGAFSQNTVELMKTFAAQSALAIQNARLFHEIEDKGRELEIASRHKSQFLANMSHELRTPLNAILGYTELVLDAIYGEVPEKMRGVLERVQTNGKHLLGLINDVLDLSKIEAGQLTLSLSDYSLANLVHGVYAAVEPLAAKKNLALTTKIAPSLPAGHGDERRLSQVLLNLVGNAIKFTDKGEVAIEASLADGSFRLAVRDSGPGIAAADQVKIFEEFQQVDNTLTKQKGGTGLGLAISKRIVEMHGGRIVVDSEVGRGSTFTIKLPVNVRAEARV